MFGKLMSISDELMARYYLLLLGRSPPAGEHPIEAKKATRVRNRANLSLDPLSPKKMLDEWNTRFQQARVGTLPTCRCFSPAAAAKLEAVYARSGCLSGGFLNVQKSRSEASRLIKQGSVELDGFKIGHPRAIIKLKLGQVLRLDRKHARTNRLEAS